MKLIPKHTSGSPIKALKLSPKDVRNLNKATSVEGYGDKVITDEYWNFIPASEIYKYGIVNSSGNMEGFIPEILESPKYSITKEGLKPKLYSGNIANHPDANNSMQIGLRLFLTWRRIINRDFLIGWINTLLL